MLSPNRSCIFRHALAVTALLFIVSLLGACATRPVPPPEPSLRTQQETVLRNLGFVEAETGWLMTIAEPISFDFNEAQLRDSLRSELLESARSLLAVRITQVRCEGHTDNLGARDYNDALSLARGRAVAEVFVEAGFAPEHVVAIGHAWDYPVESNDTREGRAANRRVNVIVPMQSLSAL